MSSLGEVEKQIPPLRCAMTNEMGDRMTNEKGWVG